MRRLTIISPARRRRFAQDEDAVVTIEFILTIPILALWFIGSFVFYDAFRSASQTEKIAFTVSDVVSRYRTIEDGDLDDLFAMAQKMLPQRTTHRWMRVTSICYGGGKFRVMWSYSAKSDDMTPVNPLTTGDIPLALMPTLIADGDSVLLTELEARWTPLSTKVGMKLQEWDNALVNRPRQDVQLITHGTRNDFNLCPTTDEEEQDMLDTLAGIGDGDGPDEDGDEYYDPDADDNDT